jgi:hypothetical protein
MLVRSDNPGDPPQRKGATVSTSTTVTTAVLFSVPRQHLGIPGHGLQRTHDIGEHKSAERPDQRLAYRPGTEGTTRPKGVQRPNV